jgi:hypothetical protein
MSVTAVLAIVAWEGFVATQRPASAETKPRMVLNAGAQRQELINAQRETTAKIDKLINLLTSGKVKVTVAADKDANDGKAKK